MGRIRARRYFSLHCGTGPLLLAVLAGTMLQATACGAASWSDYYSERRQNLLAHYATGAGQGPYAELARLEMGVTPSEASFFSTLDFIDARNDTADFRIHAILRLLYKHGTGGAVSPELLAASRNTILNFKYWPNEPGIDSMCTWSENHQILFASAGYLAGQLYPTEVFTNSGQTGTQLMAAHSPRILRWLELRYRAGFSEWLSNVYYDEDLAALASLMDLCDDAEIVARAAMVTDLMLLDIALNSHYGVFGSTHGRSYERYKKWAADESTNDVQWLAFGIGAPGSSSMSAACLAMTEGYTVPRVLQEIANDTARASTVNRQRMGLKLEDAADWALGFSDFEDGMVWLSMEAYAHPLTIELFVDMLDAYNWWDNAFFAPFAAQRAMLEQARDAGMLQQLVSAYELDVCRNLRDEVNIYTYKTRDYMLSTAQDYRAGYGGDQQHIWQATLGPNAVCWTNHPAQYSGDTPNYWTGYGWMPRAAQYKNVCIVVYNAQDQPGLYVPVTLAFTHAWLPKDQFDEAIEQNGWVFARYGDGYLAFRSQNAYTWQAEPGEDQNREMLVPGRQNIYICEMGSRREWGSFQNFRDAILAAQVSYDGLNVSYSSPSVGALEFGWTGPLTCNGAKISLSDYPRYANPYVQAAFPTEPMFIWCGGNRLYLDWDQMVRSPYSRPEHSFAAFIRDLVQSLPTPRVPKPGGPPPVVRGNAIPRPPRVPVD